MTSDPIKRLIAATRHNPIFADRYHKTTPLPIRVRLVKTINATVRREPGSNPLSRDTRSTQDKPCLDEP